MAKGNPQSTFEITDTGVTTSADELRVLCIGIKTVAGSLPVNTPTRVFSDSKITEFAGTGSQLEQMGLGVRSQFSRCNLTIVAVDAPAGAAATGSFTFGGAATTANPLIIEIEDQTISVPVSIGDAGADIAASAAASLVDVVGVHVTGAANVADLELTARSFGEHGNLISLRVPPDGIPPGVTAVVTPMSGGSGAADVASALAALGNVRYQYIVLPDSNATNLTAVIATLNDRFTGKEALDGHAFVGLRDTVSAMATFGLGEDTKQITAFGAPSVPTNPWKQVAVVAAARASKTNPKLAIRDTPLVGMVAPPEGDRLDPDDLNTLLEAGISTYIYVQDVPRVNRMVTLAKTNDDGQASEAFYDAETKFTVSEYRQRRKQLGDSQLGKVLVDDASQTQFDISTSREIIDPNGYRQLLITQWDTVFEPFAWVSDKAAWLASLEVTKTDTNTLTIVETPKINGILYFIEGTIAFTL